MKKFADIVQQPNRGKIRCNRILGGGSVILLEAKHMTRLGDPGITHT